MAFSLSCTAESAPQLNPYENQLYLQPRRKDLGLLEPGVSAQADCEVLQAELIQM